MTAIEHLVGEINTFFYSKLLIYMLIGLGLFFTFKTRFVQFRLLPEMFRVLTEKAPVGKDGKKESLLSKHLRLVPHLVSEQVTLLVLQQPSH